MSQKNNVLVNRNLKSIATITLITSVVWTALGIYNAFKTKPDLSIPAEIIAPVDASLDQETLDTLTQKRQITDDAEAEAVLNQALELAAKKAETATVNEVTTATPQPESTTLPLPTAEPTVEPSTESTSSAL